MTKMMIVDLGRNPTKGVWNLESDYLSNVAVLLNTRPILRSGNDEDGDWSSLL